MMLGGRGKKRVDRENYSNDKWYRPSKGKAENDTWLINMESWGINLEAVYPSYPAFFIYYMALKSHERSLPHSLTCKMGITIILLKGLFLKLCIKVCSVDMTGFQRVGRQNYYFHNNVKNVFGFFTGFTCKNQSSSSKSSFIIFSL